MKSARLLIAMQLFSSIFFSPSVVATEPVWQIQPTSSINWRITNLGLATKGTFNNISGEVVYGGPANLASAQIIAKIPIESLKTGNGLRDGHLKSKDFFNIKEFPLAEFRSSEIKEGKDGHLEIIGTLSLHGADQSVTLDASPLKEIKDKAGKQHLTTTATGKVNRKTAGIGGLTAATVAADAAIEVSIDLIKG